MLQYLVAVDLHDRRPSPISTSKMTHLTANGSRCRAKLKCNQQTPVQPVDKSEQVFINE